jgi:hypothetical protein
MTHPSPLGSNQHGARAAQALTLAFRWAFVALACLLAALPTQAQETVCAKVKIEIKQQLTLERQAFDAQMSINNTTTSDVIQNVGVVVKVTDELGAPVTITEDPNNLSAKFYLRVANRQNINALDGTGAVAPASTAVINWLLIPAPGAAGASALGKKYYVGATLRYRYAGEDQTLDVSPALITVKPLPLLTLDYFLTRDVEGDDPLTPAIEATEPFTLGVRVKNNGVAAAKNLKIDSAQPKIVENNQGLLIGFKLLGSTVNDAPAQNTLLADFGDVPGNSAKTARWIMEATLAGRFTEFSARFTHADELGGALTSILQATNAHLLIRDVQVDLPGRDMVRDFLAQDGDVIRVYESDSADTLVTDRSAVATLSTTANGYRLAMPATDGFVYVKLPDPFAGQRVLGTMRRADAKTLLAQNAWLSRTRNTQTKQWEYWVNVFDVNTPGVYETEFKTPSGTPRAPVLQFIPDRTTKEEQSVSFLVEASSPDGKPVALSAAPLPTGARLMPQAADPAAPTVARALFDWTPAKGTAGKYLIVFGASDGSLAASRSATITVESATPPPGPGTPTIEAPVSGANVTASRPTLAVQASTNPQDPTTQVQFEIYADEAMTQLVASATVNKAAPAAGNGAGTVAQPTTWQPTADLLDNQRYGGLARPYDGTRLYSPWVNGRFFVNLFNDAPDSFNLTAPSPNSEVASLQPTLAWTNSADKDGDAITYTVSIYRDAALSDLALASPELQPAAAAPGDVTPGTTTWAVTTPLVNHLRYYWRVSAKDALGAVTLTPARPFVVNTGNTAPPAPVIASPAVGGQSTATTVALAVQNSVDAENDLLTYVFEMDTVNTFDSGDKRTSGQVIQGAGGSTAWAVNALVENQRYHWRVKAQDGRAESAWTVGDFLMNAVNEAPAAPTVGNPGNAAWVATTQPTFQANPVQDPERDAVSYQFEVYTDAARTRRVAEGTSATTGWIAPVALADKTTHWWRVRALDAQNLASAWSATTVLYVSTGPYQDPTIQLTSPAAPVTPDMVTTPTGQRKQVTLRWEGTNPNIEPTIALYYGTTNSGFAGNLIVDGIRQTAGTQSGTYAWDVTNLSPGAYYVYGVIYDAKGVGRAYAAGAVVVPNPTQSGSFRNSKTALTTTENGSTGSFTVRLMRAPTAPVSVGLSVTNTREGSVSPAQLVFTPQNWSALQTVTVTGRDDCALDGSVSYQTVFSQASTTDPNYAGLTAPSVTVTNRDAGGDKADTTNNPGLHICRYTLVSERQIDARAWEYTLSAELTNTGAPMAAVRATLNGLPATNTISDGVLTFGAVATGETVRSVDTITLRRSTQLTNPTGYMRTNGRWVVGVTPAP